MKINLSELNINTNKCKDLILFILTKQSPLSAKKIYRNIKNNFPTKFSYQGVHKYLQTLHEDKILKRFDNEYYINPNWISHVDSFINKIKNKEDFDLTPNQVRNLNYENKKLRIKAIRFIPFSVNLKKEEINKQFKIINENEELINFLDKAENNYFLFNTGICVMCKEENYQSVNPLQFLIDRRKAHIDILESKQELSNITRILNNDNPDLRLSYVMSVHLVNPTNGLSDIETDNMLKLMTEPNVLGISDNKKVEITDKHVEEAKNKLRNLQQSEIEEIDILDIAIGNTKRIYASWSNVIISCKDEERKTLKKHLIEGEAELQHLWYYFNVLKKDLRNSLRKEDLEEIKNLLLKRISCAEKYDKLIDTDPIHDSQQITLMEGLIKTSKIQKVYRELENMFNLGKLKLEESQ